MRTSSDLEEGELLDDEEDDGYFPVNIKRRRSSESLSSNAHSRNSNAGREFFNEQNWRDEMRNEERRCWEERDREHWRARNHDRNRAAMYADEQSVGDPQAHSTNNRTSRTVRIPSEAETQTRPTNVRTANVERIPNEVVPRRVTQPSLGDNSSRAFAAKMFKVEPFPKAVKPSDQYQEWVYWLTNFEMAIEKAGITDQRARAIDLSLHIGEEMRRIIVAKEMLPKESSVAPGYPFFDKLSESLDAHFKSLTDESVDVSSFNSLKQGAKESALEFELRLRQMAKRANETNVAMIRTRYIEGLRDSAIRERAYIDGISMQEVVRMATRKEAIIQKQQADFSPWDDEMKVPAVVAAVSEQRPPMGREIYRPNRHVPFRGGPTSSQQMFGNQGQRQSNFSNKSTRDTKWTGAKKRERCPRCGVMEHRNQTCPAERAPCFGCNKIGHFRHMCPSEVRNVNVTNANREEEVQNEVYD